MKTLLSFAIAIVFSITSYGQTVIYSTNFQDWTDNVPDGWVGTKTSIEADSIMMVTGGTYGTNLCQLTNTENSHKRFTTTGLPVESGVNYEIQFWVRGTGEIRTGMYDARTSGFGNGYSSYCDWETIDSSTSDSYTHTVLADSTYTNAEFILSVRNTSGNHIQLDSVVVKIGGSLETVTIHDIQFTEDASGDSPLSGQTVTTSGIVTAVLSSGYYIQDAAGAWNGIFVYDSNTPNLGDNIILTGVVSEYNNLTELADLTSFEVAGTGTIAPEVISTADGNNEMYEGVLCQVLNATCTAEVNADSYGEWVVNDGSGDFRIDDAIYEYLPVADLNYDVTGVVSYSFGNAKMFPRDADDVVTTPISVEEMDELEVSVFPTPFSNEFTVELNGTYLLDIVTLNGKIVSSTQLQNTSVVNTSDLAAGMYMIQITQGNNTSSTLVEKR